MVHPARGQPARVDYPIGHWIQRIPDAHTKRPVDPDVRDTFTDEAFVSAIGDARVVSVVFGDSDEAVRDFFAESGGEWPVLCEE